MEQLFGICRVAVAPMRSEPSDKAENVSQLLFGDYTEVLKKTERWWYIRNAFDQYEGWVDFRQLEVITQDEYVGGLNIIRLVPASPLNVIIDPDGNNLYLSAGSNLPYFQSGSCFLGNKRYEIKFEPKMYQFSDIHNLISTALFFLNTPYLWGGKTFFGIDCSGFVQAVFKLNGIKLKRDAWQQAEEGAIVDFLQEAKAGDIAFFDNPEGRITHVGIMLSNSEIIHASAKVKIDAIDNQGIYNAELGKYTHSLRIIKRFI
jgi:cell wall-associated NlpC family hydrolase